MAVQTKIRAELFREIGRSGRRHCADRMARNSVYRSDRALIRDLLRLVRD